MSKSKKTSVYITEDRKQKLGMYAYLNRGASEAISILTDRHYYVLNFEIKRIIRLFSAEELELIYEVCRNVVWKPESTIHDGILHQIQYSPDSIFANLHTSRQSLENKLKSLTLPQQFLLVDEIERYWDSKQSLTNI